MKVLRTLLTTTALFSASAKAFAPRHGPIDALAFRHSNVVRMMSADSAADFVKTEITDNKVIVFSKSYCPFCTATKSLFKEMGVDAKIYELDQRNDGNDIQAALLTMTGQRTVPNVFINGEHLGGNDKTQAAAKSGKLQEMLAK